MMLGPLPSNHWKVIYINLFVWKKLFQMYKRGSLYYCNVWFHTWCIFKIICIYHSRWNFWFPCTFLQNNPSNLPKNSVICYRIQLAHFEGSFTSERKVCRSYFQWDNQCNPMEMDIVTWETNTWQVVYAI